jgi:hypothetical protein
MISITQHGDFSKLDTYLNNLKSVFKMSDWDAYGKRGVEALSAATPVDSGETASSWYYKIERTDTSITLKFLNSNVNDGVPIAIILQYGHGTGTGGWIAGYDYINPAIQPIFDEMLSKMQEGV